MNLYIESCFLPVFQVLYHRCCTRNKRSSSPRYCILSNRSSTPGILLLTKGHLPAQLFLFLYFFNLRRLYFLQEKHTDYTQVTSIFLFHEIYHSSIMRKSLFHSEDAFHNLPPAGIPEMQRWLTVLTFCKCLLRKGDVCFFMMWMKSLNVFYLLSGLI